MKSTNKITAKGGSSLAKTMGLSPADALEWEFRYTITKKIIDIFYKKNLTVTKIAKDSGTSRARVTRILKDDTQGISLDVLLRVLGATGHTIKLSFRKSA